MVRPDAPDGQPDAAAQLHRLGTLLDVAQEFGRLGVWEHDTATGAGHWSAHIFRLFGLEPGPAAPSFDAAMALLGPADRERVRQEFQRSLARPGRHETRYGVRHADGRRTVLHSIWQVPAQGTRVVGVLIDDTETVALAQAHEVARTQLALAARLAGLSVWRTDLATQRIDLGDRPWQAAGLDPSAREMPVAEIRALTHPDDLAAADEAVRQALAGGGPADAEIRHRLPGGWRTLLTRRVAERDADGRPVALLGVGVDISEQVETRERYRTLLDRFDMVVEATGIGVWTWDLETNTHDWSAATCSIYGLPPGQAAPGPLVGGVAAAIVPEDRAAVRDALQRVRRPDTPRIKTTFRIRRPNGALRTLVARAHRLDGQHPQLYGIVIDVTELHRAADAVRDKEAAEQAHRATRAFLSRMSHELRTPLNAVMGFGALMQDDPAHPLDGVQRDRLTHVVQAARHLLGLVDDVLELGRDATLQGPHAGQHCDLSAVIEEVLARQADAAAAAGVRLSASGTCPRVAGAARQWRQVVAHLVSNAIKYNRPGGFVQVALRETDDARWAQLEVRDSGRGIGAAQQQHLYEPFNRLGADQGGIPGTGLGLSIVRQLLQALGGEIVLHSQAGVGTQVLVQVPRASGVAADRPGPPADAPPDPTPPGPADRPAEGASADIVYVEDNSVNVLLVREVLAQRPQLRLHVAATVAEAEALVPRVLAALLLVDMHLPDGDGHQLLQRLSAGGTRPARHCIALSADVLPEEVARALAGGFDAYWAKPIDVTAFLAGVDRLLGGSA